MKELEKKYNHLEVEKGKYDFWLKGSKDNLINLVNNKIYKTRINIKGIGNKVNIGYALISESLITITGSDNSLNVENGVKLRKAEINVQSQQGNIGLSQAIRTQFRQIAANQKRLKRFTPEERKFITRVATGDAIERAARTLGKIAPTQTIPILGEVAAVGAAALSGNPALLASAVALPVIGGLAKRISSSRTARFADEAGEVIRRGP